MPVLGGEIAKLEETLADASFYSRDAAAFAEASRSLARAQAELSSAEEAWLALEARRESLIQGR
jgi:ATP-binding cassette subfamily F protein uup